MSEEEKKSSEGVPSSLSVRMEAASNEVATRTSHHTKKDSLFIETIFMDSAATTEISSLAYQRRNTVETKAAVAEPSPSPFLLTFRNLKEEMLPASIKLEKFQANVSNSSITHLSTNLPRVDSESSILSSLSSTLQSSNTPMSLFHPPAFFGIVEPRVYRSNKFFTASLEFIQHLDLKTVIYLSSDELSETLESFFKHHNIELVNLGAKGWSKRTYWKPIAESMVKEALECILDVRKHPLLIMCKSGIHLTGSVVGCLRRLQHWSLTSIIDQYRNHAGRYKTKFEYEQFIELFDTDLVTLPPYLPHWFSFNETLMEQESKMRLSEALEAKEDSDSTRPAYLKYYFARDGPLVSSKVQYSITKSIVGDDED